MNNAVKSEAILAELKSNVENAGLPPTGDFTALCNYVTDWMIRRYDLKNADDINWGRCFIWAYLVWALWPNDGEVTFKTATGHVVVKRGELYYDSEHPEGNDNIKKFCSFRSTEDYKHVDVRWMCWFWARAGKHLEELRRLVRKCNPDLYKLVRDNGNTHWENSKYDFSVCENIRKLPEIA